VFEPMTPQQHKQVGIDRFDVESPTWQPLP